MPRPVCFTSSSIGPCPTLNQNFLERAETVSITWDDAFCLGSLINDNSWFRVMHQCEPPEVLNIVDRLIEIHRYYDLILAFDERVLRECPNAVFLTESACSWLPRKFGAIDPFGEMRYENGVLHKNPVVMSYEGCDVRAKKFAVSFLTSSKRQFPGHILRQEIFERLPERFGELEVWKHRSPPILSDKRTVLEPYMFSIVPENSRHSGYYTEKLVDCFIAKTIPIYWGCTNLCNFFNMDGIVQFENWDDLKGKLESLTPQFYADRLTAIEENFHIALKGVHQWDQIENYITAGIEKKKQEGNKRAEYAPAMPASSLPSHMPYRPLRRKI
jgi:Glycosyltransferase family 10 (fucosyltransferase) C-term